MYVSDPKHSAPPPVSGSDPVQTDSRHNGSTVHAVDKNTLSCKGTLKTNVGREPNTTGQSCSQKSLFSHFVEALNSSQHRVYLTAESSLDVLVEKGDKLIKFCLSATDKVTAPINCVVLNIAEPADKLLLFIGDNLVCPMIQEAERRVHNAANDTMLLANAMVHQPALSSIFWTNLGVLLLSRSVTGEFPFPVPESNTPMANPINGEATDVTYSTTFKRRWYGGSTMVTQTDKERNFLNIGGYNTTDICQNFKKVEVRLDIPSASLQQTDQVYISQNSLSSPSDQEFDVGNTLSTSQRLDIGLIAAKVLYDVSRDSYTANPAFNDEDVSGFLVAKGSDCTLSRGLSSATLDTRDTTAADGHMIAFLIARKGHAYFLPKHCTTRFEDADATIYVNNQPTVKFQLPKITVHNSPWHNKQDNLEDPATSAKSGMVSAFIEAFGSTSQFINTKCRDYLSRPKTTPSPPETPAPTTLSNFASTADPTTADPTTADPTTADPTTADPTTADPTTADPTTALTTAASLTTAAEFDREFGTVSSKQYTEPSPLLTQNMTIETTPEIIRNAWLGVGAIAGCACLGLGFVGAVLCYLRRWQKQEAEDEESGAANNGDSSPEIMPNEDAEISAFLLSVQPPCKADLDNRCSTEDLEIETVV